MTTEDDFQKALSKKPNDWQTLLVFADWLQERNDPRAEGYRALGVNRAAPTRFKNSGVWVWLNARWADTYDDIDKHRAATVPDDWYNLIPRYRDMSDVAEERRVLREALNDAANAFIQLPPERRAELLVPRDGPLVPPPKKPKPKKKPTRKKPAAKKKPKPKKK